jgi:hypothetical protein
MLYDFCGFTFNQHHSSEMGLYRVSDGSRYEIDLVPNFNDNVVDIPGSDGVYFFESSYTSKPFNINIAFDSVTEAQLRMIRQVFNGKTVGELIYDESPYKAYTVKVAAPPKLRFICFDEKNLTQNRITTRRIYKGEGTISFIAYSPFAQCTKKFLNEYDLAVYNNKREWAEASGLINNNNDHYDFASNTTQVNLYNPGDMPTDFRALFLISELTNGLTLRLTGNNVEPKILNIEPIIIRGRVNDTYLSINSKTNLLEGYNSQQEPTGSLYNDYLISGDFFKIPIYTDTDNDLILSSDPYTSGQTRGPRFQSLEYNYLYY